MNFIDLFAGAGGLSEGFIRAGFNPIAHVEINEAACYTLKTRAGYHYFKESENFGIYEKYLRGQIDRNELYNHIPEEHLSSVINKGIGPENNEEIHQIIGEHKGSKDVDLIIGGPPCQAYSLVGRARSKNSMKGDPRNFLFVEYAGYLEKYQPKVFVFENVIGLKSAGKGEYLNHMRRLFLKKGYEIQLFTVKARNFGVLQNRRRVIIIGWQIGSGFTPPDLEAIKSESQDTVSEVFKDLPGIQAGQGIDKFQYYSSEVSQYLADTHIRNGLDIVTQHIARPHTDQDLEIYKIAVVKWNEEHLRLNYNDLPERLKTHKNQKTFTDRFKVVADDLSASQTVVAHIAKDGHYYIHPDIDQNRSISIREAARLQSFPDDYYFEGVKPNGNRTAAFTQIGNAVPPLMAENIANLIMNG